MPADPPSTYAGVQITPLRVCRVAYDAGFITQAQLLPIVAIAVSESALYTKARNWHPEYPFRAAKDIIGVQGPAGAWNSAHTRQMHSDRGLWQISSFWWSQHLDADCDKPSVADSLVWNISTQGTNFSPWDTYASGYAQSHYDSSIDGWPALRPIVQSFLQIPTQSVPPIEGDE